MKKAFTLIELLIVVLIIGILASIALPNYQQTVWRTRYSQLQIMARNFADAASRYILANGNVPNYWADLDIEAPAACTVDNENLQGFFYCPDFTCDLMGSDTQNIICYLRKQNGSVLLGYAHWFDEAQPDRRECWAPENNSLANNVCKSLGGTSPSSTNTYTMGDTVKYILP